MQSSKRIIISLFLISFAILNIISYSILLHFPSTGDEHAFLFQAKIFSLGKLYVNEPPIPKFFDSHYLEFENGR